MSQQAKFEAYKKKKNLVPPVVYQTWHTKDMHYVWVEQFRAMKQINNHITFKLFTDQECRKYIKTNFDKKVLWAYDVLAPTAYKADLWRYCVLYKEGGVYLDIKLLCYEIDLLRKEEFLRVEDIPQTPSPGSTLETYYDEKYYSETKKTSAIWQAVMASVAGNKVLKKAIDSVVDNVFNNNYGMNPLSITGPLLLCSAADSNNIPTGKMMLHKFNAKVEWIHVRFHDVPIIKLIDYYRDYSNHNFNSNLDHTKGHYSTMWKNGQVFNPIRIAPRRVVASDFYGKYNGVLNVCNLSNNLFLVEKLKSKLSVENNATLVSTGNIVTTINLFDNRTKRHEAIQLPSCNEDCIISGFRDPKCYGGSLTFNARVNNIDFTVYVPSAINVKKKNSWVPIKSKQLSFFNLRDQEYCVTAWSPHVEIAKFTKSSSEYLTERKTIFKHSECAHTDWATNGIKINEDIWFLGRMTVRRKPTDRPNYSIVSYCYYWIVFSDSLTSMRRSCVFQTTNGNFHKVSKISYDVTNKTISIEVTFYDEWSRTLVFSKDSFNDLLWRTHKC